MNDETAPLTREDALVLLDDLEEVLPTLEAGGLDEEERKEVTGMIRGLRRLPRPADVLEDRIPEVRGWTELLLAGRTEDRQAGTGSTATLLRDQLADFRTMVEEDVQG